MSITRSNLLRDGRLERRGELPGGRLLEQLVRARRAPSGSVSNPVSGVVSGFVNHSASIPVSESVGTLASDFCEQRRGDLGERLVERPGDGVREWLRL